MSKVDPKDLRAYYLWMIPPTWPAKAREAFKDTIKTISRIGNYCVNNGVVLPDKQMIFNMVPDKRYAPIVWDMCRMYDPLSLSGLSIHRTVGGKEEYISVFLPDPVAISIGCMVARYVASKYPSIAFKYPDPDSRYHVGMPIVQRLYPGEGGMPMGSLCWA